MNRIINILIALLTLGVLFAPIAPAVVYAQVVPREEVIVDPADESPTGTRLAAPSATPTQAPPTDPDKKAPQRYHCNAPWNAPSGATFALQYCLSELGVVLLSISALALGGAGYVFDFAIRQTVQYMSAYVSNIDAINIAWGTIRDVANMFFIFILLYIAIGTILHLSSINMKRMLTNVIIAALLLNFSLFFTKVIIDASNILALGFMPKITDESGNPLLVDGEEAKLSAVFMQALGLQGFWNASPNLLGEMIDGSTANLGLPVLLLGSTLIFVAAFVFFVAAGLFLIRFVVLVMVMILSPLAFMGSVLPWVGGYAKQWWSVLFNQAFFAPFFMLMIGVVVQIINNKTFMDAGRRFGGPNAGSSWGTALFDMAKTGSRPSGQAFAGLMFNYFIVIAMLLAALIISKRMASAGGGAVSSATNWITGKAAGFFTRNTVGRVGTFTRWAGLGASAVSQKAASGAARLGAFADTKGGLAWLGLKGSSKVLSGAAALSSRTSLGVQRGGRVLERQRSIAPGLPAGISLQETRDARTDRRQKRVDDELKRSDLRKNPEGLAKYMAGLYSAMRKYVWEKLGDRERTTVQPFLSKDIYENVTAGLTQEEKEKTANRAVQEASNDPEKMLAVFKQLPEIIQSAVYGSQSPRNRVVLEGEIGKEITTALTAQGKTDIEIKEEIKKAVDALRANLSVDEREKTEGAEGEVRRAARGREARADIQRIAVNEPKPDGTPYADPDIDRAVAQLPQKDARKLSPEARVDARIVQRLSTRHLSDLVTEGELTPEEIRKIVEVIEDGTVPYPNQRAQYNYIHGPNQEIFWTV